MAADRLIVVLGDQLFAHEHWRDEPGDLFMAEDQELCIRVRHHQQKLVLVLSAMRHFADEAYSWGRTVRYHRIDDQRWEGLSYAAKLRRCVVEHGYRALAWRRTADRFAGERLRALAEDLELPWEELPNPAFLTPDDELLTWFGDRERLQMADFYRWQRRRMGVLLEDDGHPEGGRWSYDADNRQIMPEGHRGPDLPETRPDDTTRQVVDLVAARFGDHPGTLDGFAWPVTRRAALVRLRHFVDTNLADFGPYQDAISHDDPTLHHAVLSPMLNLGLITPGEILEAVLEAQAERRIPMNSIEGFVRQLIGWREFVRGVDLVHGADQRAANHWDHHRGLAPCWYDGTTGLPPLDVAIGRARKLGYAHHIERLMVLGNCMLLCEIHPRAAYTWFMELFVDSADWVMGPNVFGMALMSDGGLFASKPYICGSNYLRKMGRYPKGEWCEVMDGLYWRFVAAHKDELAANPRTAMAVRTLERQRPERLRRIVTAAEGFIDRVTTPEPQRIAS